jgi:zinc and cadmium transporter
MLLYIILATVAVSVLSLVSVSLLALKPAWLKKITMYLVALSAGSLMGAAFFHLLPEAVHEFDNMTPFVVLVGSYLFFFIIEKWLHWQHCHDADCEVHTFGYLNLLGDALHNFLDGLIIAAAFTTDVGLGIATTIAIVAHEVPQEISDFGVLIHSGFSRKKALLANFLVALTAVLGGVLGGVMTITAAQFTPYLVAAAAGGFLYISSSDLLPELRKETDPRKTLFSMILFIAGLVLMYALTLGEVAH